VQCGRGVARAGGSANGLCLGVGQKDAISFGVDFACALAFAGAGLLRHYTRGVSLLLAAAAVSCAANVVFDGCAAEFP